MLDRPPTAPLARPLRLWLTALALALVAAALLLSGRSPQRALLLAALVLVGFVPFGHARLRLHRILARHLGYSLLVLVAVAGALCDAAMVAQLLTSRSEETLSALHGSVLSWVGPVWFSTHALFFLGYTILALLTRAVHLAARVAAALRRPPPTAATEDELLLGRRELLQQFSAVGAGLPFAVSLSGVPLSYDFRVDEHEIELPGWPRRLDGLRVAHLSDIHVGGAMNRERLLRVAELTNAAQPDLVLHTGDFLTHRSGDFDLPLYEALARIRAPFGQWACLGNHDFDDVDRLVHLLGGAGVTTLRSGVAAIDVAGHALELAGVDFVFSRADREARYAHVAGALQPRRDGVPRLLLVHDPSAFAALPAGCADLVLSGHTHGGHLGVQLGHGRALTVVALAGYPDQGLFEKGDMRLFVTRCVGFYGYPMRIGIPPEIALLTLRAPAVRGEPS